MDPRDLNLNQHEQVEVLAEIIKAGNIRPEVLLQFIRNHSIRPDWGNVALPRGRTLNQCMSWFNGVNQSGPTGAMSGHVRSQSLHESNLSSTLKRPFSPDQLSFAGGRPLQPKPPLPGIGNMLSQQNEPPKKKRGRPSNAQKAAEREAAMARGELLAPPKRELQSSNSSSNVVAGPSMAVSYAAQAAQAAMAPQQPRERPPSAGESDSSSTKRRRGRPPNSDKEAGQQQARPEAAPPPKLPPSQPSRSHYPNILSPQDEDVVQVRPRP